MPYIESFNEFAERQACRPLTVRNRFLFSNGAQSDGASHLEPPSDPAELLLLRHEYAQAQLDSMIERYQHDRDAIATQAHYHSLNAGPMPEPGWEEHLQTLVAEIEKQQIELSQLTAQLPTSKVEHEYRDYRNSQRRRAADVTSVLQQLPVF